MDLRSVLVLADANSVARAEDRGSRRPGGRAWGKVCADHAMQDLSALRPLRREEYSCFKGEGSRIDTLAVWEGSWLRLGGHESWETRLLSDWHYPLLWIVEVPEPQLDRPESVVEKRVKEQHMHPVRMTPELRYQYHWALARRQGTS